MTKTTNLVLCFCVALSAAFSTPLVWAGESVNAGYDGQGASRFAKVIDDLPLMPGLVTQEDKDVLFVAGKDRIAQTTAAGAVQIDDVYKFYSRTLPQLGWKAVDKRTYEREKERLRIDVTGKDPAAATVVKFSIEPLGKK
jgi:hypothetical protein